MSLIAVTFFQIERLFVLSVKIGSQNIAKRLCRRVLFIIGLFVCIILSPVLVIYDKKLHIGIQCFFDIPGALPILSYFYLTIVAVYVLFPFSVLPSLNVLLIIIIRRWSKQNVKLTSESAKTRQSRTRHEVKAGITCALISIYTSICLLPNILWFLLLLGMFTFKFI